MDTFFKNILRTIKAARKKNGLSQDDLAKLMGVTRVTVARWETGNGGNLNLMQIQKIANILNIVPSQFFDDNLTDSSSVDEQEEVLLQNFRKLNSEGKKELIKQSRFYSNVPELTCSQCS